MTTIRRTFAVYEVRRPSPRRTHILLDGRSYSVRTKAAQADAKIPKEQIPEHEVVMTIVTWTAKFRGVNVSPGAVAPGTAWTEFGTPRTERTAPVSGASAAQE